jgi:hypothetical protein
MSLGTHGFPGPRKAEAALRRLRALDRGPGGYRAFALSGIVLISRIRVNFNRRKAPDPRIAAQSWASLVRPTLSLLILGALAVVADVGSLS